MRKIAISLVLITISFFVVAQETFQIKGDIVSEERDVKKLDLILFFTDPGYEVVMDSRLFLEEYSDPQSFIQEGMERGVLINLLESGALSKHPETNIGLLVFDCETFDFHLKISGKYLTGVMSNLQKFQKEYDENYDKVSEEEQKKMDEAWKACFSRELARVIAILVLNAD